MLRKNISNPTVDLHCHLRGAMLPSLALKLAKESDIKLPPNLGLYGYKFTGFDEFLSLYDQIGRVVQTASSLKEIAYAYLCYVSVNGTKYVEFMISPTHSMANGVPFSAQIAAISEAIEQAKSECNVTGCIIITCVRHRGPEDALETAKMATELKNCHIRGFGLTGNEREYDIEVFKEAFLIAGSFGLGLTAHAGEWLPAKTVLRAVNQLNLARVGHGISVTSDQDILAEMAERNIGFEICLSSNVQLGASESYATHPVRKMIDAGCRITFSTDDPAYFNTTPAQEMCFAIQHLKLTEEEQRKTFDDSVEMAFCCEKTKAFIRDQT
ncbi:MAG: adenosine deaminase [Ekhidna sp.]